MRAWLGEEVDYGHLFYWIPVCLGVGAVLWFSANTTPSTPYIAAMLLPWICGAAILRYRRPIVAAGCLTIALLCVGALLAAWETSRADTVILDSPVTTTVTGVVIGREAVAGGRWRYSVELSSTEQPILKRAPRRVTLTSGGRNPPLAIGSTLRGRARLLPPSGPALVGLNDFAFDAYFSGSGAIGFFYGAPRPAPADTGISSNLVRHIRLELETLRGAISARIRTVLPGDTGAFAASMVTDDRRAISKETTEALRLAGLSHIVAISGLNMALAAGIFFVGIRGLLSLSQGIAHRYPIKKFAAAGALATVTGYYLISGFAVSAERAYLMMAIMLGAVMLGRPAISLRNAALSAIVIIVLSPSAILGPGFQMSYAATLALIAGYSIWQNKSEGGEAAAQRGIYRLLAIPWMFAVGVFASSLIGGLSTALFSIEHFHRVAAWGLPANLLAMPIISIVVMPAALAALLLMPVGLDWLPLKIMGLGLDVVILVAKWAASLGGEVAVGRIHGWLFLGLTLSLIMLGIMRSRLRLAGLVLGTILIGINAALPGVPRPDMVVHEDGSLVGLVRGDRIATTELRPGGFIFEQWQRALPVSRHVQPIVEASADPAPARRQLSETEKRQEIVALELDLVNMPSGRFRCRKDRWCVARSSNGTRIIVIKIRDLVGAACDRGDMVITPARLFWSDCQSGAKLLSQEGLRRSGTVEIRFDPDNIRHFRILSVLGQGDRPWYVHRTYDWRSGEFSQEGSPP
ncbi:MAG: ComEC/Rec2 family competence protein [Rhizobium sp.]|nr:ComEC/Rec2 family competence protein [Rhizobium sp.]